MRTRRGTSSPAVGTALVAVLTLSLTACTGGDGSAGPSGGASSVSADPSTAPSSGSPAPTPSGSATGAPGDDSGDDEAVEPTATPLPGDDPVDEQPFPADTTADVQEAGPDARLGVTGIRVGTGDGYDRVVIDLEGEGLPGWDAQYRPSAPAQEGSGNPVEVDGDAVLWVTLTGLAYPGDGVTDVTASPRTDPEGTQEVEEVVYDGVFEGQAQVWVGLDQQRPFRVFRLENPTRVVIDVVSTDG